MKAIDKVISDFKSAIENGDIVLFKTVSKDDPFDTLVEDNSMGKRNIIFFKEVLPNEEVSDEQILSFVPKVKWNKMCTSNILKEKYLEFLSKKEANA